MKHFGMLCAACAAVMLCSACGTGNKTDEMMQADMTLTVPEGFDQAYSDCLKTYFEAIEHKDYAAYQSVVYPPYLDVYADFLKENDKTVESAFDEMCTRFDEDGYESWHITELQVPEYTSDETSTDAFFQAFVAGNVFDDAFVEQCKKDAQELQDVKFSLYVLYQGDEEAVPVAENKEILMVKTSDGTYLFG